MINFTPSLRSHSLYFFLATFRGKYTFEPRSYVHLLIGMHEEGKPWHVGRVPNEFVDAIASEIQHYPTCPTDDTDTSSAMPPS